MQTPSVGDIGDYGIIRSIRSIQRESSFAVFTFPREYSGTHHEGSVEAQTQFFFLLCPLDEDQPNLNSRGFPLIPSQLLWPTIQYSLDMA